MSKFEKLLEKIKNNPKSVRFEEIEKVLLHSGFKESQSRGGSSHYNFRKDGQLFTIPRHGQFVKEVYILQVIEALDL